MYRTNIIALCTVSFSMAVAQIHLELEKRGVVCDKREPSVIRLAPAPLYNKFSDVVAYVHIIF